MKTVTAVVTVRNGEKRIARALESIARQTRMPDEVLVVDGRSTDRTVEISRSYDFVSVLQQPGQGIADAYNFAVESAGGDLIAFLSHDDEWTPDKIEWQAEHHKRYPEILVTTALARFVAENPGSLPPGFRPSLLQGEHVAHIMETLMARREVFDRIGMFDPSLKIGNDVDWFSRVQDAGVQSAVIRKVLLIKYIHADNSSLNFRDSSAELLRTVRDSIIRKRAQAADTAEAREK